MKRIFLIALAVLGPWARADEFTLKESCDGTVVDWTASANYVGEPELPQDRSSMIIRVPAITVTVTDDTVAQIANVEQLLPQSGDTKFVFDITNSASLNCCITSIEKGSAVKTDGNKAQFVKKGPGDLYFHSITNRPYGLTSADLSMDYALSYDLREGALHLPAARTAPDGRYFNRQNYPSIDIASNATLYVGYNMYELRFHSITGYGLITNDSVSASSGMTSLSTSTFHGRLGGAVTVYARGNWKLLGTNSTQTALHTLHYGGILSVMSIGMKGVPSSCGVGRPAGSPDFYGNAQKGTLRYLGTGETSDKIFCLNAGSDSAGTGLFALDAGATGGLRLTGNWIQSGTVTIYPNQRVELCGSNTTPCTLAGLVEDSSQRTGGYYSYLLFSKTGTGTWIFENNRVALKTPLFIFGGTLGFTTLLERGLDCAAGRATHLVAFENVDTRTAKAVDFAFQLGKEGSSDVGTFALMGTNITTCTTRPFALAGRGRLLNDMPTPLRLDGFHTLGTGSRELILDGEGTAENEISGLVDSEATPVSIVKDGPGNWALNGSNTVHGSITVKGGTLRVMNRDSAKYGWFEFLIRGKSTVNTYCAHIGTIGLYDASGNRVFTNPSYVNREVAGAIPSILPGQVALPRPWKTHWGAAAATRPFGTSPSVWEFGYKTTKSNGTVGEYNEEIDPSNRATWVSVLMRLTNGAPEVASYDCSLVYGQGCNDTEEKRQISSWTLRGSVDGIHWASLHTVDDIAPSKDKFPEKGSTWASRGTVYSSDKADLPHTGGFAVTGHAAEAVPFTVMDHVGFVSVVSGGVFACEGPAAEIRKLEVDAASGGTISNFTFAADTELNVVNLNPRARSVELPGTFQDVSGLDGVAGWTLKVDDAPTTRYKLSSAGGRLRLRKAGLVVILK